MRPPELPPLEGVSAPTQPAYSPPKHKYGMQHPDTAPGGPGYGPQPSQAMGVQKSGITDQPAPSTAPNTMRSLYTSSPAQGRSPSSTLIGLEHVDDHTGIQTPVVVVLSASEMKPSSSVFQPVTAARPPLLPHLRLADVDLPGGPPGAPGNPPHQAGQDYRQKGCTDHCPGRLHHQDALVLVHLVEEDHDHHLVAG